MIDTRNVSEIERHEMVTLMIGREINEDRLNTRKTYDGPVILSARNICLDRHLYQVSFDVKKGRYLESLDLWGLVRLSLARCCMA